MYPKKIYCMKADLAFWGYTVLKIFGYIIRKNSVDNLKRV